MSWHSLLYHHYITLTLGHVIQLKAVHHVYIAHLPSIRHNPIRQLKICVSPQEKHCVYVYMYIGVSHYDPAPQYMYVTVPLPGLVHVHLQDD